MNCALVTGAAGITALLSKSQAWLRAQRWVMGSVLALLAVRIALPDRR